MFHSKRNGIYYLWFRDEFGKRQKVTTHARTKSKALEFLRNYSKHISHRYSPFTLMSSQTELSAGESVILK